jgi:hypothetical protein
MTHRVPQGWGNVKRKIPTDESRKERPGGRVNRLVLKIVHHAVYGACSTKQHVYRLVCQIS